MKTVIAAIALLLSLMLVPAQADDASSGARTVLDGVTQQALSILRDKSLSPDARRDKFKQMAYDNMNFEAMSRISLGANYNKLTPDQQKSFQDAFKQLIANTYGHLTDDYTDEQIKITGDRAEGGPHNDATVETEITGTKDGRPNSKIAGVDYRLRKTDGNWKVIDFTVDGVSLDQNYKSQFQSIMSNGSFDQLMKMINDKIANNGR